MTHSDPPHTFSLRHGMQMKASIELTERRGFLVAPSIEASSAGSACGGGAVPALCSLATCSVAALGLGARRSRGMAPWRAGNAMAEQSGAAACFEVNGDRGVREVKCGPVGLWLRLPTRSDLKLPHRACGRVRLLEGRGGQQRSETNRRNPRPQKAQLAAHTM